MWWWRGTKGAAGGGVERAVMGGKKNRKKNRGGTPPRVQRHAHPPRGRPAGRAHAPPRSSSPRGGEEWPLVGRSTGALRRAREGDEEGAGQGIDVLASQMSPHRPTTPAGSCVQAGACNAGPSQPLSPPPHRQQRRKPNSTQTQKRRRRKNKPIGLAPPPPPPGPGPPPTFPPHSLPRGYSVPSSSLQSRWLPSAGAP